MAYNIPTGTSANVSFGPALLFLGASGATPTVDVGWVSEDGLTVEVSNEIRDISQGNPRTIEYSYAKAQSAKLSITGIEWNQNNLQYALGAGNTYSSSSLETWAFGGDPLIDTVSLRARHYMAVSGHTWFFNVWKARGSGSVKMALIDDEHKHPLEFMAMRASTNWAGASLAFDEQLYQMVRQKT